MKRTALPILLAMALGGCADTGRTYATVELASVGAASPVLVDGSFTVTLTRADVAFGPAYLCATPTASSELCATAVLEVLQAHPIDGLSPMASPLATLGGVTGTVRSAQYDFGIPFLLTESTPRALPGSIGGHSAVIEATATDGATTFDLHITLDVAAKVSGTTAMVGAPLVSDIPASGATVTVGVDPREWLRGLDWAALAATPHAPSEPVVLAKGTSAYDTVLRGMTVNHPPTFVVTTP